MTRSLSGRAPSTEHDEPPDRRHAERHKLTVIGGLAALLTLSYRQVIAAFSGGRTSVSRRWPGYGRATADTVRPL